MPTGGEGVASNRRLKRLLIDEDGQIEESPELLLPHCSNRLLGTEAKPAVRYLDGKWKLKRLYGPNHLRVCSSYRARGSQIASDDVEIATDPVSGWSERDNMVNKLARIVIGDSRWAIGGIPHVDVAEVVERVDSLMSGRELTDPLGGEIHLGGFA